MKHTSIVPAFVAVATFALALLAASVMPSFGPRASANSPNAGLDFTLHVDDCNTQNDAKGSCQVPAGSTFMASVSLDDISGLGNGSYDALAVTIDHTGVGAGLDPDITWPDCWLAIGTPVIDDFINAGCAIGLGHPSSTYTGEVARVSFGCVADGTLALHHGQADTLVIDSKGKSSTDAGPDVLNIDCVDPAPYPTDTDGDGCPDMNEAGPSPLSGGQRNFLNEWDYFNPTHDGLNRIDDILAVRAQYFVDQGDLSYTQDTDRTLAGPNLWNTGPPNGLQRVDDILNSLKQYFHDCS